MNIEPWVKEEVQTFVNRHTLATVSTIIPEGLPDAAAVFVWIGDAFCFQFATRLETHKASNVLTNQNVMLTITDRNTLEILQVWGTADFMTHPNEVQDALLSFQRVVAKSKRSWMSPAGKIMGGTITEDTSRWLPPAAQIPGKGCGFVTITPTHIRFRRYESEHAGAGDFVEYTAE
ncbi:pyridoxamine 5'-phosphate oxidase family protein [bacterium]|nr:pyridoxamine 5'-phosphate oxidase family protein [bacterium]